MNMRTFTHAIVAAVVVAAASGNARGNDANIFQATLAEAGQKTEELSTDEMRGALTDGTALVLDTRTQAEFDAGHIPGARVLDASPEGQEAVVLKLVSGDKTRALVLYCNGPYCQASRRLADRLVAAGFTNVRRYQLGIPVWRALGGPVALEIGGVTRIFGHDKTAVFLDARTPADFRGGSVLGAKSASVEDLAAGRLKKIELPEDDFNRRVILFGRDASQARQLADVLSKRPWHNVAYFNGNYDTLAAALGAK